MNYYNEIDPFAAKWLSELMAEGLIPEGEIDTRSIAEVQQADLKGFTQCHFFAGIGGWPYALSLAGWGADKTVWTGSCPCQSLSVAGLGKGAEDERHLWPEFARLICECRPPVVLGEQVASALGREWLAGVRLDLAAMGYAVGAADLCAAGVGAPHIRQRLWWVAESGGIRGEARIPEQRQREKRKPKVAYNNSGGCSFGLAHTMPAGRTTRRAESGRGQAADCGTNGGMADAERDGGWAIEQKRGPERRATNGRHNPWAASVLIPCADGKWRRVPGRVANSEMPERRGLRAEYSGRRDAEIGGPGGAINSGYAENQIEIEPAIFPLADGIPNRVGTLRGAGNAINPWAAAEFIKACTTKLPRWEATQP